ncbi:MAG: hypothetical protein HY903_21500 [Deltaproteobacteria bacterium]|nr:hypothetical protein [Deltaproteobacteria bacterium]
MQRISISFTVTVLLTAGAGCSDGRTPSGSGGESAPVIETIDGTGSVDGGEGHSGYHLRERLSIHGQHLALAAAKLMDGDGATFDLAPCETPTDTQLSVRLPDEIAPGQYTLVVMNQAGSCNATVQLLQGEKGEKGDPGAGGPSPVADVTHADYGAVPDDGIDDAPAIQQAVEAVGSGGTIYLPKGTYEIASTIEVTTSGIRIVGEGQTGKDATNDGVTLKWIGAAGGTMVAWGNPDATALFAMTGGGIEHVFFNGNYLAGTGLRITNGRQVRFHDLYIRDTTLYGLDLTADGQPDVPGAANRSLVNTTLDTIEIVAIADTVRAGIFSGEAPHHMCFGSINNIRVTTKNAPGILIDAMDDVIWSNIATARLAGGTGRAMEMSCKGCTFSGVHAGMMDGPRPELLFRTSAHGNWAVIHGVDDEVAPVIETVSVAGCADNGQGRIAVTTAVAHGLPHRAEVEISGVVGTTEANGRWIISKTGDTTFTLIGSTYANAYASGGTIRPHNALFYTYTGYQANQGTEHVQLPPILNPVWLLAAVTDPANRNGLVHDLSRLTTLRTITWPNAGGTLLLGSAAQMVSNKILDASNTVAVADTLFTIENAAGNTLTFDLTNLTNNRTVTLRNASGIPLLEDVAQTVSNKVLADTNTYRIGSSTPASSSAACTKGTLTFDATYVYICVAANTWKRASLASW